MKNLIVANWKMNPQTYKEAEDLVRNVIEGVKDLNEVEVVLCPPFPWLTDFSHKNESAVLFGAQDVFYEDKGAFTGEISAQMLKSSKVDYVIIGHSERRKLGETDEIINKKIKKALESQLKVIFCVGETADERDNGKTNEVLERQIKKGLEKVSNLENINIAYEPVWAISSGDPYKTEELPTVEKVKEIFEYIRGLMAQAYNQEVADKTRIIYGGSANAQNAKGYLKDARMQGLLVGGASLDAQEFTKIVKSA